MSADSTVFSVSSTKLEDDVKAIRSLMDDLATTVHSGNAGNHYVFSSDAVYAMGWYFYELSISRELVKKLLNIYGKEILAIKGRGIEQKFSNWLRTKLEQRNCDARVKPKSEREFRGFWPWLLR